jgi:hypothetical protein
MRWKQIKTPSRWKFSENLPLPVLTKSGNMDALARSPAGCAKWAGDGASEAIRSRASIASGEACVPVPPGLSTPSSSMQNYQSSVSPETSMTYWFSLWIFVTLAFARPSFGTIPEGVDITAWPTDMLVFDALGDHETLPDPRAQVELARRPNAAEEIISRIQSAEASGPPNHLRYYIRALTAYTRPSRAQQKRVFALAQQAYHREKESLNGAPLGEVDRVVFGQAPLIFWHYEQPRGEGMLLDMMERADVRWTMESVIEMAAEKPTPARLGAMKRRLADMEKKYPEDVRSRNSSYLKLVSAIETAQRNLAEKPPGNSVGGQGQDTANPRPFRPERANSGLDNSEDESSGFCRQPFVWVTAALLAAALGLLLLQQLRKSHR